MLQHSYDNLGGNILFPLHTPQIPSSNTTNPTYTRSILTKPKSHHSLFLNANMSFSDLPTELIVHVFKSVDNIGSAAALSQTSHHLHEIWRHNLSTICDAVFPRTIECYDQACQLLEAMAKSEIVVEQSSAEEKYDTAVVRAKVLVANRHIARRALELFTAGLPVRWDPDFEPCTGTCNGAGHNDHGYPIVKGPSRIRFMEAYYRAYSILYLGGKTATRRYQFLASMSLMEFFRMFDIVEYVFFDMGWEIVPDKGQDLPGYDSWPPALGGDDGHADCLEFLIVLEDYVAMASGIQRPMTNTFRAWGGGPSYQRILHDDCLDDGMKKADSIAMAHILPQLPKQMVFKPRYELFTSR